MVDTIGTQQDRGSRTMTELSDDHGVSCPKVDNVIERVAKQSVPSVPQLERAIDDIIELCDLVSADPSYTVSVRDYPIPDDFRLSIVVPVFNECGTIHEIIARVDSVPFPKEIIIVDDGSTDGTRELLEPLDNANDVRVILHEQNRGKGAALRSGFSHATGDVIAVQDADLEYDPQDFVRLVKPILDGTHDVVYGSRYLQASDSSSRGLHRFGNQMLTRASNLFTGLGLTDMETCYKVFRKDVLAGLELRQDRFGFEPEITAKIARRKCRLLELPVKYDSRGYDEGKKIGVRDAFNAIYCIVRYWLTD